MGWIRDIKILVRRMIQAALADVHTHIVAQVVSYTAATNTCSIQPCVTRIRAEDPQNMTTVELPQIDDVPVKQFGSGKCLLSVAPQAGSYGVFHVSEKDLENWLLQGGVVDPTNSKRFDLSDGFFDPGAYPLIPDGDNGALLVPIETDRIALRNRLNTCQVAALDDGTAVIKGTTTTVNDGTDFAVQYTALKSAFDTLKQDLNNLVTAYNAHIHITTATVGIGPPGVIAPTTSTGTPSAADMSSAQIATVKLP
jgi:hypothetical protein